ncbi:uncharacterized protein LACBIDRAFT_325400 [Laccaria bicolor S238N-H82]|uniref:F-box domain-containing protein n=1 Tax=Laccaria bicolor (strain S238N-H82 / ATCC MYA-4686) TaxID=486041 RepID=B0D4T0_LACBS|nr:uncharacterized protein LACBIDRAFT_325400 [Laccaria bicolor S238N-H82]EDR10619.1 hypothetical protein LACBIDRAFT_325400 [Laccaria bicolor S238N-H82]|eukprot:XP_001879069.1 hypothetical protein LACBIDRAFT_325400 [Laccaria bicolor S238N-H82]
MPAKSCDCGPTLAELLLDWPPEKFPELDSATTSLSLRSRDLREQFNAGTPFLSLPREIILEISIMACEPVYEASDPDNFVRSKQLTSPLLLAKICQLWRCLVLHYPRLWNVIFLNLRREPEVYRAQLELLKSWLLRSGELLLSIHLEEMERDPAGWVKNPPVEVFDLLARYSHRWLHVSTFLVRPCWEGLEKLPLPSLTTLAVRPPTVVSSPAELRKAIWRISYAPCLRNAYLVVFDKVAMDIPMHQLTQITMKSCMRQDCLSLLASTPNVVHCALLSIYSRFIYNLHPAVIALPYLSSLTMASLGDISMITRLLDCITTPALSRMRVICGESRGAEPFASIGTFLSRSSCSLRELSFKVTNYRETTEQALIAMLTNMETLEKLELHCKWGGKFEPVFYHLNPARPQHTPQYLPPSRVVLPNLRCFRYKGPMSFEIHHLIKMIDMRYRMSIDREKDLQWDPVGRQGIHNCIARPESFDIEILEMKRDHYYTILCDYADTLERLMEEHDGIVFSFCDEMGDNIPLQNLIPVMDPDGLAEFFT